MDETNFYDAVVTYFKALKAHYTNGSLQGNLNDDGTITYPSLDAKTFRTMICNRSIEGANRNITMNHICDRIDIGYAVYDMNPDTGELEVKLFCSLMSKLNEPEETDYLFSRIDYFLISTCDYLVIES